MHFQRFTVDDEKLLAAQINDAKQALSAVSGDTLARVRSAITLGNLLTTARRERESIEILSSVEEWVKVGPPEALGWWLLYLGTAKQYLDDRSSAQQHFDDALQLAVTHELKALESYVLHHMGRCYVEAGDIELGLVSFQRALALREELGDPRQASTRRALEALSVAE